MEFLLRLLGEQWVIGAWQLLGGKLMKQNPEFANKWINVMNYITAIVGFLLLPASANAAAVLPFGDVANVAVAALFQTVAVTGLHSTFKNTVIPVAKDVAGFLLGWLQRRITRKAE